MLEKNYEKEELIDIIDNNINNKINDIQEIKKQYVNLRIIQKMN